MSFSDPPRESRAPRKARPRLSLKMQAIGFLSRREHSRQELRAKLLDSLRKRAREEATLAAAADKAAQERAEALRAKPPNGIDEAFAPPGAGPGPGNASAPTPTPTPASAVAPERPGRPGPFARAASCATDASSPRPRAALDTLALASGAPLPARLRANLASRGVDGATAAHADLPSSTSAAGSAATAGLPPDDPLEHADPEAAVDQLLDWLAAHNYLSEARFVESRVNARSRKQGTLRIKMELSRHGLTLEPEQAATLRETELARAQALWQRKFGEIAPDARSRAKQARFLAARGFAGDVVRRVVGGEEES